MEIATEDREAWMSFFGHPRYRQFVATTLDADRTALEVDAIRRWLGLPAGASVLDLGCGYGRLAVPLAEAGYAVTGIDGSPVMVEQARAQDREGRVRFLHGRIEEAAELVPAGYDAVISMSTAFGYTARPDADAETLAAAAAVLKPGGRLLVDTENREAKVIAEPELTFERGPFRLTSRRRLDLLTGRWRERLTWTDPGGSPGTALLDVRLYAASELATMLGTAGFGVEGCWGWFDGSAYTRDSPRLIMLARRTP